MLPLLICMSTYLTLSSAATTFMDDRALIRHKRQATYYLCGTYPNEYYSTIPCPGQRTCPNGGRFLDVGCRSSAQCTPYYSGVSTCINGCCCTVPMLPTTPPSDRFGFCPSGQLSEVRCSGRNQCQAGQTCMTGLCCTTIGNEWNVACGGLAALASCNSGMCATGVCTASNYCCECPVGRSSGRCNSGICPAGFACNNGFCCPQCPSNVMPFGACRNGICGGGKTCRAGNICC